MSLTEHESLKSFMLSQMLVIIASLEFKRNSWTSKAYFFEDGTWRVETHAFYFPFKKLFIVKTKFSW